MSVITAVCLACLGVIVHPVLSNGVDHLVAVNLSQLVVGKFAAITLNCLISWKTNKELLPAASVYTDTGIRRAFIEG